MGSGSTGLVTTIPVAATAYLIQNNKAGCGDQTVDPEPITRITLKLTPAWDQNWNEQSTSRGHRWGKNPGRAL